MPAKNAVNILAKNFIVFAASSIAFLVLGWGLCSATAIRLSAPKDCALSRGADNSPAMGDAYKGVYSSINWTGVPLWTKFFLPAGVCRNGRDDCVGRGGRADQVRRVSYFHLSHGGIIYPIAGHWIWGGGWAASAACSTSPARRWCTRSVAGRHWRASSFLGPRIGKYGKDGKVTPIPGHSMASATIGGFVLWFGWFGFNPGSTMAADAGAIGRIAVTTNTAGARRRSRRRSRRGCCWASPIYR